MPPRLRGGSGGWRRSRLPAVNGDRLGQLRGWLTMVGADRSHWVASAV
ncbi:hypothetical protein I553_10777 [Mycobacterium xenopi 4042]|uniref:Uncharacterized protein n=1 Tax=Mycobacterium xenopi 4042 TaxID=1299334 RepID=X8DDA4_MYCXE|nr:hypothetical protein I553_10777 [Mycobacterium xenopi 4042]